MRKNKFIRIAILLALCGQVFAQAINVDISNITVAPQDPGFFKPGETMTLTIDRTGSNDWSDDSVFMMIVLSKDNTISADDYLLEISGNSLNMKDFSSAANNIAHKTTGVKSQTFNLNFQVPAGLTGDYYIIVRVGRKARVDWSPTPIPPITHNTLMAGSGGNIKDVKTKSTRIEFSSSKYVVYNTAIVGDKSSRAKLIINGGPTKLNVLASDPSKNNNPFHEESDTVRFYKSSLLGIELKTVDGKDKGTDVTSAGIYYTLNGTEPAKAESGSTKLYKAAEKIDLGKDLFQNGDTVRIKTVAVFSGSDYDDSPVRTFVYIRKLPKVHISIENYVIGELPKYEGSDAILFDTDIFGVGESELGIPQRGNIKLTAKTDDIPEKDVTSLVCYTFAAKSSAYTPAGIEINETGTLKAYICSGDSDDYVLDESYEWSFVQDLPGPDVKLKLIPQGEYANYPAGYQVQFFGLEQNIQIEFNHADGDTLWYHIGDKLDGATLKDSGVKRTTATTDIVKEPSNKDTIYVSVYVVGSDNKKQPTYKFWTFVRSALELEVKPSETPAYKFIDPFDITAKVSIVRPDDKINPNSLVDFGIWYTTDGTDPSPTNPNATKVNNDGKITISQTTTIKIIAWAYDRAPSKIQTHNYRLVAVAKDAWFIDTKGQGGIDRVIIHTTIPVESIPDNVRLVSPWEPDNIVIIQKDEMSLLNNTTIIIARDAEWIFPPLKPVRTNFEPNPKLLGNLFGAEYNENLFAIGDSIAPIPVEALYSHGSVIDNTYNQTGNIERYPDTLTVYFSETISIHELEDIFEFYSGASMQFRIIDGIGTNTVKFEVIPNEYSKESISDGDSLRVRPSKIQDANYVIQNNYTGYIPIKVIMRYSLKVTKVSPIIAGESKNPVIVIDFLGKAGNHNNININGKIIDATGNIVANFDGFNKNGNIFAEIDNRKTTRIYVRWNGKNRTDRNVGVGAYLVILSIADPNGTNYDVSETIGVGTKR